MIVLPLLLQLALDGGAPPARATQAILDDAAQAVGGKEAFARHKTLHITHEVSAKQMGFHGTEEVYSTSAGKTLVLSSLDNVGKFRQGSDGKVQWTEDPINGLRILQGVEEDEARLQSAWDLDVNPARYVKEVRPAAPPEAPPAGQAWECLEFVPKVAPPITTCFDARTHLRVLQKGTRTGPQGKTPMTVRWSDWRDTDGIKIPFTEEMTAGPLTMISHVTSAKFDEKLDPKLFALPKGVGKVAPPPRSHPAARAN